MSLLFFFPELELLELPVPPRKVQRLENDGEHPGDSPNSTQSQFSPVLEVPLVTKKKDLSRGLLSSTPQATKPKKGSSGLKLIQLHS